MSVTLELLFVWTSKRAVLHMANDNLTKALVSICNQLIKRIGGKIASSFFGNIFGTRSLTLLLWYARPSYVGVASGFLFLQVSKDATSGLTFEGLNEALVAIRNQDIKRIGGTFVTISFGNIFGTRSLTQLLWYAQPSYVGVAPGVLFL